MKVGNTGFISLLILTSALSANAHDGSGENEKKPSSFPAAKEALTAVSGQPRIEYEFEQNSRHEFVSVFEDGVVCYEMKRSKGDIEARFILGDEEPDGLPEEGVFSAYIEMKIALKMGNDGMRATAKTAKPCVFIDVYSDPREGESQSGAEDLGRRRGRRVADKISSHWKVGEVTIRSHGWKDNAILRSDQSQARARVELDLSCTGPQLPDDIARLDVRRTDMRQFIEDLSVPVSTVSAIPPPHGSDGPPLPTFVWRSSPRTIGGRSTRSTSHHSATVLLQDVCPTSTAAKLAAEQGRLAKLADAERVPRPLGEGRQALTAAMIDEVDSIRETYGRCESRLDRLFREMIRSRCNIPRQLHE